MTEHRVILNGNVYLYRQKAPFVQSGFSIQGGLEYDPEEDRVRCHECGEWFNLLATHVYKTHEISVRAYKQKHGLNLKCALINESIRHRKALAASRRNCDMAALRAMPRRKSAGPSVAARERQIKPKEKANERNLCHAQVVQRLKELADSMGRAPSKRELWIHGISVPSVLSAFNVSNVGAAMTLIGFLPNPTGRRHGTSYRYPRHPYTPGLLIELLRDFYVKHHRVPTHSDFRRGLLPDKNTFIRKFGSWPQTLLEAGLSLSHQRARLA